MAKRKKFSKLKLGWKKCNTSTKILILLGVFNLIFIVTMIVIFCIKTSVPDTLITCVLGAGGVETLALSAIKISKVIKGETLREVENNDC